jgi:hypothetical protein
MSLGPELIINGAFDNGSTGWTVEGNWDFITNKAKVICLEDYEAITLIQTIALTVGKSYRVAYEQSDIILVSGYGGVFSEGNFEVSNTLPGSYEFTIVATKTSIPIGFFVYDQIIDETITFDNISVREIITDTPSGISIAIQQQFSLQEQ